MDLTTLSEAAFLGVVEGLTEFLPVSSTGHLILLVDLLGFKGPPGKVFEIVIQLGAILAVLWVYKERFLRVALGLAAEPAARRFALNIIVAFLPAMVLGVLFHGFIKRALFSPWVVCSTLILGGFAILWIEAHLPKARIHETEALSPLDAVKIGFCQSMAMVPGVSRSGATIMGGMLLGLDRKAATEFSFFLAIPTMFAATIYDLFKNREGLAFDNGVVIAVGFIAAFIAAILVVRALIAFISRHGFGVFAYYRIAVGLTMLGVLVMRGS